MAEASDEVVLGKWQGIKFIIKGLNMQKIQKGRIVSALKGNWYRDKIGETVEVRKFTHNMYLDANDNTKLYRVKDIKLIEGRY